MARGFKGVRHSGCRSPLMLTLFIIAFIVIFCLSTLPAIIPSPSEELEKFIELINKEYNENKFTSTKITEQDYNNLEYKITSTATNPETPLIMDNTLVIDNFVSPKTTLNKQLVLNGNDVACLLNLIIDQTLVPSDTGIQLNKLLSVNSFNLDTVQDITSIMGICKLDMSQLKLDVLGKDTIPTYIYLTLYAEINITATNYIITSKIKVNDLNDTDNEKATNFLQSLLGVTENQKLSDFLVDELVRLLRVLNTTFKKDISFTTQYIIIG